MDHCKNATDALKGCVLPYLNCDPVTAKALTAVERQPDGGLLIKLEFGFPTKLCQSVFLETISRSLRASGITEFRCDISHRIKSRAVQPGVALLKNIKNIIAVASGKGGVGKSTVSVNVAEALSQEGARVGILDADIYGPSQPRMLGCSGKPELAADDQLKPMLNHSIQSMSIGYIVDTETPLVWRGPMAMSALDQLLNKTTWDDLDYLIIDLPPGTGDVQLSLCQRIPLSGAVIVTTPQMVSYDDALKSLKMLEKVNVPIIGIVENMSAHVCSQCGHRESIFGEGGGEKLAREHQTTFLGSVPLNAAIRDAGDVGIPITTLPEQTQSVEAFRQIARSVSAQLSLLAPDHSSRFPKIVVDNR